MNLFLIKMAKKDYIKSFCFNKFITLLVILFFLGTALQSVASTPENNTSTHEATEETEKGDLDAGALIIGHLIDSYYWHICDIGEKAIAVPLPIILIDEGKVVVFMSSKFHHGHASYKGYEIANGGENDGKIVRTLEDGTQIKPLDFSFTKNAFGIFISSTVLILIFLSVAKSYQKRERQAPKGLQSLVEPVVVFIRDEVARKSIGEKHYEKFLPYLLTVFFFILINNLFGLIPFFPFGANITGSLAVTGVLALFTFFITTFKGNKNYYAHIFNTPGVPWWLKIPLPLMPIIELVGVFTKPFVLAIRLFANITAGHIVILGFISLIFVFGQTSIYAGLGMSVVSIVLAIFMNVLELLVAFIQAYVFTLLSSIYFGMAVEETHHE